jgi:recombination protein RecA
MSQAMRKFTAVINRSNTILIFINQIRMKIGVMFGNPETTTGGNALKFYSSIRLDIRKINSIKEGQDTIGNRTKVKVVKNKVAPPFKAAEFDIMFGEGASKAGDILDLAVEQNFIDKSGAWYSFKDERIGQGRENAKRYLIEHGDVCRQIENTIRLAYGMPVAEDAKPAKPAAADKAGDKKTKAGGEEPPARPSGA